MVKHTLKILQHLDHFGKLCIKGLKNNKFTEKFTKLKNDIRTYRSLLVLCPEKRYSLTYKFIYGLQNSLLILSEFK